MHRFALVVLLLGFLGCKSDKTSTGKGAPPAVEAVADDASAMVVPSKTANLLPPELDGLAIGMSIDEFRAARKATGLRVTMAYHALEENSLTGNESDEELMAKLDAKDAYRTKVEAADWPGKEGYYHVEETFEKSLIQKATYTFRNGILREAIVYYSSPEQAAEATRVLLGKEYTSKDRWSGSASVDALPLMGWAFKDRYAIMASKPVAKESDSVADAGAAAEPVSE